MPHELWQRGQARQRQRLCAAWQVQPGLGSAAVAGRDVGLGLSCRHRVAGPPCCFVLAALREAGEFIPGSVEAELVTLQISGGVVSEPSSSASVTV